MSLGKVRPEVVVRRLTTSMVCRETRMFTRADKYSLPFGARVRGRIELREGKRECERLAVSVYISR